jgi:hypothetical protein
MSTGGKKSMKVFWSALLFSQLAFTVAAVAQNATQNTPQPDAWNMELVGASQNQGQVDLGPYSKMSPWPNPDGDIFYSGCYDPAPLDPRPEAAQCFMTVSVKDPNKPQRLATVYVFDPVASPEPPASHPVWKSKALANLPVKVPCDTFKDPAVLAGTKRPACWDPGWNTHTHYVAEGPGKILAVNEERRRGIGTDNQANYHGVSFYDVSNPAKPVFLSRWQAPISDPVDGEYPEDADGIHHFNFRNLGANYKGYVGMILVILDARDPRHPVEAATWHIPGQKTPEEDAQRDWVQQRNFSAPIRKDPKTGKLTKHVAMHYATVYGNTAYLSYRQAGLVTLDVSDIKNPKLLSRLDYLVPGFVDPTMPDSMKKFPLDTTAFGNAHSAKLVPGRRDLLWLTDEYFSCPYGHLRMVDVADPTKPKIISHFLYPENTACDPANPARSATPARFPRRGPSTHIGNVRDGVLFLAWYGMCARAIDIHDPLHPFEAGHFIYQIDPSKKEYAGCDTYDIILGQNGLLYVSDGTSGLRVLKYTGATQRPAGTQ